MFGKILIAVVLAVFAAIISFVALKQFTFPYLWIALTWVAVLLCAWVLAPRARAVWLGATVVTGILALLEGWAGISAMSALQGVRSEGTFSWVTDDILGYVAPKGVARTEKKFYRGEKVYDVVYTMDANGHRVTPETASGKGASKACVLFFGDSSTFGWGLNDPDTMPYRVGVRAGGRYRSVNMAFLTHGPQQMLATFDHDLVGKVTPCKPGEIKYVVYQTTPDHVRRAAGLRDRVDLHRGPQYALEPSGHLTYQGQFGNDQTTADKIERQLSKSFLYRRLVGGDVIYSRSYKSKDVALYLTIVDSARARLKVLNSGAEFHILFWGNDPSDKDGVLAGQMLAGLRDRGLTVHRVNDILPGADRYAAEWFFGGFDPHPSALANDRIAEYIVRRILRL